MKAKFDFVNFDEADTFIEAAKQEPFWSTMMLVALKCGLRRGELRALQWDQIDLKRRTLTVDKSCDQEDRIKSPKNGRARTVDLGARVVEALSRHPRRLHCPWVFPSDDLDPLKDNEIKHPLWRAAKRAELLAASRRQADVAEPTLERVSGWHIFRHTFCSHLVMRGAHLVTVMELARHSDIRVTMRYSHLAPQIRRAAVELLDAPSPLTVPQHRHSTQKGTSR